MSSARAVVAFVFGFAASTALALRIERSPRASRTPAVSALFRFLYLKGGV